MTEETKTLKGVATRDFNDAGTGKAFEKGKSYDFAEGVHANYLHAGLIGEPDAASDVDHPLELTEPVA